MTECKRKPKRKMVRVAYFRGMPVKWKTYTEFPGYDSCSPFFDIAKDAPNGWAIVHAPTGLVTQHVGTLAQARAMCGVLAGLGFDWRKPGKWAQWQRTNLWLMPWFQATGQVMTRIF